jgi:hypothetical protein
VPVLLPLLPLLPPLPPPLPDGVGLTDGAVVAGGATGGGLVLVLGVTVDGAGEPFVGTPTFGSVPVLVAPGVVGTVGVVSGAVVAAGGTVVTGGAWATCAVDVTGGAAGSLRRAA